MFMVEDTFTERQAKLTDVLFYKANTNQLSTSRQFWFIIVFSVISFMKIIYVPTNVFDLFTSTMRMRELCRDF